MIKLVVVAAAAATLVFSIPVTAQQSMTFDWEDGVSTALGTFGGANLENSSEQAQSGTRSLKYWEDPISGTPQAYIWWITGCADGDVIDASFYVYDVTPDPDYYPRGRIWAHYTSNPADVTSYSGSAGGSSTYSSGIGWEQLSNQWTFASSGDDDGIVIEARIYSGSAGSNDSLLYVDTAYIQTSSGTAIIHNAADAVPVELSTFAASALSEDVKLTWSTASEQDNLGFNILRTMGLGERAAINVSMIPGAGTTLEPMFYSYVDQDVTAGLTYRYWLEQIDFQGTTELFGPVSVTTPAALPDALSLTLSPIPVDESATISLAVPNGGMVTVNVYDMQGREVAKVWNGEAPAGVSTFNWERAGLGSGTYVLRADSEFGSMSQRIVLK